MRTETQRGTAPPSVSLAELHKLSKPAGHVFSEAQRKSISLSEKQIQPAQSDGISFLIEDML